MSYWMLVRGGSRLARQSPGVSHMLRRNDRTGLVRLHDLRGFSTTGDDNKKKEEPKKDKPAEDGQTLGEFLNDVSSELKSNEFFQQMKTKFEEAKKSDKEEDEKRKPGAGEASSAAEESDGSVGSRFRNLRESIFSKLPQSFGDDDKTWDEAFKSVFGIRVEKKKVKSEDLPEWFEAIDKETGDRYYYNDAGETVWERPQNAKIIREATEEAHDFVEHEIEKELEPSFLEQQIAEKAAQIGKLEEERDAAQIESDMAKFKELNGKIREIRKEIEKLSQQANTKAMVHVEEKKNAWEQFGDSLKEAPILKDIFGLADSDVAKKARDAAEDAREALETSQNPLVYRMYSVYDSVFGETEMGEAIKEFRRIDPEFTMETFLDEMQYDYVPMVIRAFLRGDVKVIDAQCAEGSGAAIKAAIKERQTAGRKMDENILSIGEMNVAAAKVVDKHGPLIVIQFMVQQINCLYDLTGKVVEGKDDEIVGVFYIMALTRVYDEEANELKWQIKEFAIGGSTPWI